MLPDSKQNSLELEIREILSSPEQMTVYKIFFIQVDLLCQVKTMISQDLSNLGANVTEIRARISPNPDPPVAENQKKINHESAK
jgi:hypothetical protein